MAFNYTVVRVVENISQLEKQVQSLLDQGWKLAGGITAAPAIGDDNGSPFPTLVYLQALSREE